MSVKNTAQLTADNTSVIVSQTTPESITPITGGAHWQNIIDSMWNRLDGITIGTIAAPMVIPSAYTSLLNPVGDKLEKWLQVLANIGNATSISVQGGVQGRIGEFLANVTAETNQIILNTVGGSTAVWRLCAVIKEPNDKDGGCFDNGNNFLINRFITPVGGQVNVVFGCFGASFIQLENNFTFGTNRLYKLVIAKNGVPITVPTIAESNIINPAAIGVTNYFDDFQSGAITTVGGDVITLELWENHPSNPFTGSQTLKFDFANYYNKLP